MIQPPNLVVAATLLALLMTCSQTNAITVNLNATKDNTLFEDINGLLSNGAGPGFFAGKTGLNKITRGLILFDVEAGLPSSVTITSATLTLNVSKAANALGDAIQLKRVSTDWGEAGSVANGGNGGGGAGGPALPGDATWTHSFSPNTAWTNIGGDFSEVVSASQSVGSPGSYAWTSSQLADDVQDMLDTPNANFGWVVTGNELNPQTAKRFDTRESSNPPVLTIEYNLLSNDPPDYDGDGDVDGADLGTWSNAYGTDRAGDADGDTDTDGADFFVWQREFTGPGPGSLQSAVVPEPTSASLALVFLALGVLNRHRNARRGENSQK